MAEDIRQMYVATRSFEETVGAIRVVVTAGVTRVGDGNPLLDLHPDWFERDGEQRVEAAVEYPGETRTAAEVVW